MAHPVHIVRVFWVRTLNEYFLSDPEITINNAYSRIPFALNLVSNLARS
jgi:hypothetical protein